MELGNWDSPRFVLKNRDEWQVWICDWMLNKNYESHTRSQIIGNCFQFPSFRHKVKAITTNSTERDRLAKLNFDGF